jgi:hypothetical protein
MIPAKTILIEAIGWVSTGLFLFSILVPNRRHLHLLGIFAAITTGVYAYYHGATAIWVKWLIAFFFHGFMYFKKESKPANEVAN